MRLVIKIAGALLEREENVQTIARQITELARAGHELLVVHGGGKIFTATLARMGIEQPVRQWPARDRSRDARRGRDGFRRLAEQAHGRGNFAGRPAGRGHQRFGCGLLSGRADADR